LLNLAERYVGENGGPHPGALAHLPTAVKRRTWVPWRNPKRRSRYRLVTADIRKRHLGLLRIKRFRHRGPNLHTRIRYHRVWTRRGRRRRR